MARVFEQSGIGQAGLTVRLAALVYDALVVTAILFAVAAVGVTLNDGEAVQGPLFNATVFLSIFLFNGYFWTRSGQTLGMMAWRLRVQTLEGYSVSWRHALKRFMVAILSLLLFGIGYWWMLFNDERLTLHDRLSDTRVVRLPKQR